MLAAFKGSLKTQKTDLTQREQISKLKKGKNTFTGRILESQGKSQNGMKKEQSKFRAVWRWNLPK